MRTTRFLGNREDFDLRYGCINCQNVELAVCCSNIISENNREFVLVELRIGTVYDYVTSSTLPNCYKTLSFRSTILFLEDLMKMDGAKTMTKEQLFKRGILSHIGKLLPKVWHGEKIVYQYKNIVKDFRITYKRPPIVLILEEKFSMQDISDFCQNAEGIDADVFRVFFETGQLQIRKPTEYSEFSEIKSKIRANIKKTNYIATCQKDQNQFLVPFVVIERPLFQKDYIDESLDMEVVVDDLFENTCMPKHLKNQICLPDFTG